MRGSAYTAHPAIVEHSMTVHVLPIALLSLACAGSPAWAQDTTVIQTENVRFAYAQVMHVTPVYQTLVATRTEQQCDQSPRPDTPGRLSRAIGAVKGALGAEAPESADPACRAVTVAREFRRPIAYDVDYVYKGAKFRSRLPVDPGNRLRIRVGVTPAIPMARNR